MTLHSRPENSRKNLAPLNLPPGGGGGGTLYMKGLGMLVVSHGGENFRFWSRLGFSGQTTIIFSRKGLLGLHSKKYLKIIYFQFISFTRIMLSKFKMIPFRSQKRLGHAQIGLLIRGFIQNFRRTFPPLSHAESPPGTYLPFLSSILSS